ncbi:MAG: hypothetical protein ACXWJH_07665 [Hyphomicrobium sp.]
MHSARMFSGLFAALVLAASLVSAPAEARSKHRAAARTGSFDGSWSVLIVTNKGQCDQAYRYGVTIRDGQVFYNGSLSVNFQGQVTPNGYVSVHVSAGSSGANGTGRMSRDYGTGVWRGVSSTASCSGTWTAERRG